MSWNFAVTNVTPSESRSALIEASDRFFSAYNASPEEMEASKLQAYAAIEAADILAEQVQPDAEGKINITLSGHANPGAKKREGWANDTVTISVTQA